MKQIEFESRRAAYQHGGVDWQDGQRTVVFLHGAGMDHTVWQQQSRALAHGGYNVAAVDLPGHGESEDLPGIENIADYADWVVGFLNAAGVAKAVLVGHSLGGSIAIDLAARHPGRVEALVLIGVGQEMKVAPQLLDDTKNNTGRAWDFITAYTHGKPTHAGGAPTPGQWMMGSAMALLHACPGEVLHRDFKVCDGWDGKPLVKAITCPALVTTGRGDRMTPPKVVAALAGAIPDARYQVFEHAGHMVQTEDPRGLLKVLKDFLAGLP